MVIQLLSRIISFSLETNILQLRGIGGCGHFYTILTSFRGSALYKNIETMLKFFNVLNFST